MKTTVPSSLDLPWRSTCAWPLAAQWARPLVCVLPLVSILAFHGAAIAQTLMDRAPLVPSVIYTDTMSPYSAHRPQSTHRNLTSPSARSSSTTWRQSADDSGWRSLSTVNRSPRRPAAVRMPVASQTRVTHSPARSVSFQRVAQDLSTPNDPANLGAPYLAPDPASQRPLGSPTPLSPQPADAAPSLQPLLEGDSATTPAPSGLSYGCGCAPVVTSRPCGCAPPALTNYRIDSGCGQPVTAFRPVMNCSPYFYGSSLFGRPKLYVAGQPVLNFFRSVLP